MVYILVQPIGCIIHNKSYIGFEIMVEIWGTTPRRRDFRTFRDEVRNKMPEKHVYEMNELIKVLYDEEHENRRFKVDISPENTVNFTENGSNVITIKFKEPSDAEDCRNSLLPFCYRLNRLNEDSQFFEEQRGDLFIRERDTKNLLREVKAENKQLKTQIKIFEEFLKGNDLDIDWNVFCTVEECPYDDEDFENGHDCQYCENIEWCFDD